MGRKGGAGHALSSLQRRAPGQHVALGLVEAGQDEIGQVERKGLRLDNRKDLALRSTRFKFQINTSVVGSSSGQSIKPASGGMCSIS